MSKYAVLAKVSTTLGASAFALLASTSAWAAAQEPAITGDRWMAYGILGGLILAILAFVFTTVGIAKQDAAYERGHRHHNEVPGYPMLGDEEDGKDDD